MMNNKVLVLNLNFEPINVCTERRAIGLILSDKASLVLDGRGYIKTVTQNFPRPSVIRLQMPCRRPKPRAHFSRREIFRRDNYTCQYCGRHTQNLTVDHVIPRHLGGRHTWHNVVAACSECNHRKGGRTLQESKLKLLRKPAEPPLSAFYVYSQHLTEFAEWEPFLIGW